MTKIYEVRYVSDLDYNRGVELYSEKYFSTKEKADKFVEDYKAKYPERYRKVYITKKEIEIE